MSVITKSIGDHASFLASRQKWASAERMLLRRASWGPSQASVAEFDATTPSAWLEAQLNPAGIADPTMTTMLAAWPRLGDSIATARARNGDVWTGDYIDSTIESTIARTLWSKRQLFEQMVYLWSNHFNVPVYADGVHLSRHDYDRTIRSLAMGKFSDLLYAVITHPAMLRYLNAAQSRAGDINENLGRELLELHTLGEGNYTETDVKSSALALTGLSTREWWSKQSRTGEFEWRSDYRYVGPLKVLGWSHTNVSATNGLAVVKSYLLYLAKHPATARRIATKLAVRFVSDDPPAALIDKLAAVYLSNDTAIVPVLRALFTSRQFATSTGGKIRTPQESLTATIRALGVAPSTVANARTEMMHTRWLLVDAGHEPLNWPAPNGYPDVSAVWTSPGATLARFNMTLNVSAGWWPKFAGYSGPSSLLASRPATHGALLDALAARLQLPALTEDTRTTLTTFMDKDWRGTITASTPLLDNSDVWKWRLYQLVGLLLNHPDHAIR